MTIMSQHGAGGGVKGRRCDGTCHNAKKPNCKCICGGRYHGAGDMAQEKLTQDWFGEHWREKKAEIEAAGGSFEAIVSGALLQAMGGTPS